RPFRCPTGPTRRPHPESAATFPDRSCFDTPRRSSTSGPACRDIVQRFAEPPPADFWASSETLPSLLNSYGFSHNHFSFIFIPQKQGVPKFPSFEAGRFLCFSEEKGNQKMPDPPSSRPRRLILAQHVLQLHRQSQVSLHLQLAGHEGRRRIQVAEQHDLSIGGGNLDRTSSGRRLPLFHSGRSHRQMELIYCSVLPRQIKLIDGLHSLDRFRVFPQPLFDLLKNFRCRIIGHWSRSFRVMNLDKPVFDRRQTPSTAVCAVNRPSSVAAAIGVPCLDENLRIFPFFRHFGIEKSHRRDFGGI